MDCSCFTGKFACFYSQPGQVVGCLPLPTARMLVGQVVRSVKAPNCKKGDIPNATLTIRGRSGREVQVSLVEQYVRTFDSFLEASACLT
jgi:hypothetical protein